MSEITPEKIAAAVCEGVGGWRESLTGALSVTAEGNMLSLAVARWDTDDTETVRHFRAVVVEGESEPIVLERPAMLEQEWGPADEVRSWVSPDLFVVVNTMKTTNVGFLTPVEARRLAARLAALADEAQKLAGEEIARRRAEAAQAEQERQS